MKQNGTLVFVSILLFTGGILRHISSEKMEREYKEKILLLEGEVRKKPIVILPQPKRFRIKFSNEDDTFYVYPVLDDKWKKPVTR